MDTRQMLTTDLCIPTFTKPLSTAREPERRKKKKKKRPSEQDDDVSYEITETFDLGTGHLAKWHVCYQHPDVPLPGLQLLSWRLTVQPLLTRLERNIIIIVVVVI